MSLNETKINIVPYCEALNRLKAGNERFVKSTMNLKNLAHKERRESLIGNQTPFAIILSCSDSRVPSEIVFDQGLGDLFVIRIAGNIVAPSIIGSVEFAAATFKTQLVVVMGHTHCGAVSAALDAEINGSGVPSENIRDIVERISPSIKTILKEQSNKGETINKADLIHKCIKTNVNSSVEQLKNQSKIIQNLIKEKKIKIVGAEYSLQTGEVHFYDNKIDLEAAKNLKTSEISL